MGIGDLRCLRKTNCWARLGASNLKSLRNGYARHCCPLTALTVHGVVQVTQITAGTSVLRDTTKMERIGPSRAYGETSLITPLSGALYIRGLGLDDRLSNHAENRRVWLDKPRIVKRQA